MEHSKIIGQVFFLIEDEIGIYVIAGVGIDKIDSDNFSIGFKVIKSKKIDDCRIIEEWKLYEISIVENPVQNEVSIERITRKEFLQFFKRFRN